MRKFSAALGFCCVLAFNLPHGAQAQPSDTVISVMAGEPEWMAQAAHIASQLDHENHLRILPVLGAGGVQALSDLIQLPGIDAAIVASDSLAYARAQNLLGDGKGVAYVAKLAPLDLVLVARNNIKNITGLAGKRIATGPAQSAVFASGEILFGALEIPFLRVPQQGPAAIDALLSGRADAALMLGSNFQKAALSDGRFHILNVSMPPDLTDIYQPAILSSDNFPGLIAGGKSVETVSASLTLAVQNWPRNSAHVAALKVFENALYTSQGAEFSENLAASILGWTRHSTAQEVLGSSEPNADHPILITPTGGKP